MQRKKYWIKLIKRYTVNYAYRRQGLNRKTYNWIFIRIRVYKIKAWITRQCGPQCNWDSTCFKLSPKWLAIISVEVHFLISHVSWPSVLAFFQILTFHHFKYLAYSLPPIIVLSNWGSLNWLCWPNAREVFLAPDYELNRSTRQWPCAYSRNSGPFMKPKSTLPSW